MHAAIHVDLQRYFVEEHSQSIFDRILNKSGFTSTYFESSEYFQDTDLELLLKAATEVLGMTREEILLANGIKAAPGLLENFKAFLQDGWNTLDIQMEIESSNCRFTIEIV
ncbi:MAG: heme NO-binding domain-containing protein [Algicola sp.]|nr:heme NO-binding domain-containing protein [Algicola sp.]